MVWLQAEDRESLEVMEPSARLEDYFEFYLFFGERLPRDIVSFIAGSEFVHADGRDRCRVQLTDAPSDSSERPAFFLDILLSPTESGREI